MYLKTTICCAYFSGFSAHRALCVLWGLLSVYLIAHASAQVSPRFRWTGEFCRLLRQTEFPFVFFLCLRAPRLSLPKTRASGQNYPRFQKPVCGEAFE